jgi:hypothetical protein
MVQFAGKAELFSRKGRQTDGLDKSVFFVAQGSEEIDYFSVEIVVCLDGRRAAVEEHRGGTSEWFAVVVAAR